MSRDDSKESAPLVKVQFNSSICQGTDLCLKLFLTNELMKYQLHLKDTSK